MEKHLIKIDDTRDQLTSKNYFLTVPQGVIIQDSYNNFAFPIRPYPQIDNNKSNLLSLKKRFQELYLRFQHHVLPWHFVIEMIKDTYVIYNTRPITMRYPLSQNEIKKNEHKINFNVEWDKNTQTFFKNNYISIEECIHVCIMGDSNLDVYPKLFYKMLSSTCVRPFLHWFKLPQTENRIFALNVGKKFNFDYLFKFLTK